MRPEPGESLGTRLEGESGNETRAGGEPGNEARSHDCNTMYVCVCIILLSEPSNDLGDLAKDDRGNIMHWVGNIMYWANQATN